MDLSLNWLAWILGASYTSDSELGELEEVEVEVEVDVDELVGFGAVSESLTGVESIVWFGIWVVPVSGTIATTSLLCFSQNITLN